jgi:hypothetical protein
MTAFPESGRSDQWKITKSTGRFRPEAVIDASGDDQLIQHESYA